MKFTNVLTIFSFGISTLVIAADGPTNVQQARRQPYKEVRTKQNQDPNVREALKKRIIDKQKHRMGERKRIEAQMATNRVISATNRAHSSVSNPATQPKASTNSVSASTPSQKRP
jgi:hypothetical protein